MTGATNCKKLTLTNMNQNSMDWIFLLQLSIVGIVWFLMNKFYRNSQWLHTNKPNKITISSFPKFSNFIEGIVNSDKFIYVVLIIIVFPAIFGGLLVLFSVGKGALKGFEQLLYSITWWEQVLIWISIILCYIGIRIWWDGKKGKSFLSSKKEDVSSYRTKKVPQKVSDINADRIPTYPRFTIYEWRVDAKERQIIFDSSDFLVINKAFGLLDGFNYNTILTEQHLNFKGDEYLVTKLQVDFLDIFDDYSINPLGNRHTKVYEGRDVPYNIQVIVETKRK